MTKMMMICEELVPFDKSYIKNMVLAIVPLRVLLKHSIRLLTYLQTKTAVKKPAF